VNDGSCSSSSFEEKQATMMLFSFSFYKREKNGHVEAEKQIWQ